MATARPLRRARRDASSWILTSLAVSLVVHLVLIHVLGGLRVLDVEVFRSSVTRWFSIDERPVRLPAPDIAREYAEATTASEEPDARQPQAIAIPDPVPEGKATDWGPEQEITPPALAPDKVRAPHTSPAVLHHRGPGVDVDQADADLGSLAPVGTVPETRTGGSRTGTRAVMGSSPGLPSPPPVDIDLPEVRAQRPARESHAAPPEAPTITPTATVIALGGTPVAGIEIPLGDASVARATEIPRVILNPPPDYTSEDALTPVVPFAPDEVRVDFTMYAEPGDEEAYFRAEIAVARRDRLPVIPKDVMFICDVSLSIRNRELAATREAVVAYLRRLRRTDRFNVVAFAERPRKLFPDFVEPTAERLQATHEFVDRIPGQVKTDVYRVLNAVVRDVAQQSIRNRPTNIFFISDGRSTSGIRDVRRIVNEIGAYSRPNFAVFPFDAGKAGNRYLLDLLAYRSRGALTCCDEVEGARNAETDLFLTYDNPVLMQLRLEYTNLDVAETYPSFLPNLYADHSIVIYGRCKPGEDVTIQLQGKNPYARRELSYSHTPGAPDPSRRDIAREWARRKIHHIVSEMARVGETRELKAEIKALGDRFNVPTPYGG